MEITFRIELEEEAGGKEKNRGRQHLAKQ